MDTTPKLLPIKGCGIRIERLAPPKIGPGHSVSIDFAARTVAVTDPKGRTSICDWPENVTVLSASPEYPWGKHPNPYPQAEDAEVICD